ncbi:TetR/AcrR family transcriptional regulator [Microbacterium sediminis]|uniref:HTH tetR-type domain-containing protein n=1 Tax=Microbacterium sediminis TaxID=904291 RepID=A0A1B9NHW8_9MICO|nr:TetR/AcrR family transcriptional regulator [Microbacterium sediminis]OCG76209.1 hypothetical protein A7J15_12340 [Microbacterium sediminis]
MSTETPQPRSRENTRARLLDAAAQVFAEVGLGGASVEAIVERAGFTRGAFYSNFDSKDELFLGLAATVASERIAQVRQRMGELVETPTLEDLGAFVLGAVGDRPLDLMLTSEIRIRALRDAEFGAAFAEQQERLIAEIAGIVSDVAAERGLSLRVSAEEAARMLLAMWEATSARGAILRLDEERRTAACAQAVASVAALIIG